MIVCLGTTPALARTMEFDGLAVDAVNRATRVYEYAAGKAVNAARAALRKLFCVSLAAMPRRTGTALACFTSPKARV